jgi:membrane-associated phospholipid phosphatase
LNGISSNEFLFICGVTFLYGRRPKLFYYLTAYSLNKFTDNFLKIFFNEPRPLMMVSNIEIYSCSHSFGQPSGHSSDSIMIAIVLFLDLFYGSEQELYAAFYK